MQVIAIANQKGGVGKTTTAVNLGASLAALEKRTLVIDLDPQGNTTSGFGLDAGEEAALYGVLLNQVPLSMATRRCVGIQYLDVVPTNQDLAGLQVELLEEEDWQFRLRKAIAQVQHLYDVILLDCPPSLGVLTVSALTAADSVLIPVQSEYYALEGLSQITTTIREIQRSLNPGLRLLGIVLTMYDSRLKLAQQVAAEVQQSFGARLFRTRIPRNVSLAEAPSFGRPVLTYNINSSGAQSYLALAQELLQRLDRRPTPQRMAS